MKAQIWIILFLFSSLSYLQAQDETGFVEIQKGQLYYKIFNSQAAGVPLLFLNGGPGIASSSYHVFVEALAKKRKVILFDQRGLGKSKLKRNNGFTISVKKMVDDIERLRVHLNISEWDIMGNSWGGTYAMFYATKSKSPHAIRKMILSASGAASRKSWNAIQRRSRKRSTENMLAVEKDMLSLLIHAQDTQNSEDYDLSKRGLNARYYVYKAENIIKAIHWFTISYEGNPDVGRIVRNSMGNFNLLSELPKFDRPVLILHGMSDFINIATPLQTHEALPNSRLEIIQECGHMIWLDQPERMMELIDEFLE